MKNLLLTALAVIALAVPSTASAAQWFDYNGQALVPDAIGGTLSMYSIITNDGSIETPIPLTGSISDRYTLVITDLELLSDDGTIQTYAGGSIQIIEDDATAANFGDTTSFTDGTVILEGTIQQFTRIDFGFSQSGEGSVDWTGGTRIDEIAPADRLAWAIVASISNRASVLEPGFDENWNGKVEPGDPIVSEGTSTWGQLKKSFD